jgi:hypothetical protein
MFTIEPMPSKVNFMMQYDENNEQAMIVYKYEVLINLEPEDITITDMMLEIENVESEPIVTMHEIPMEQSVSLSMSVDDSVKSTKDNSLQLSKQSSLQLRPITVTRNNSMLTNQSDLLFSPTTGLPIAKPKVNLKDVEIYYVLNPSTSNDIQELNYTTNFDTQNKIVIPVETRQLKLIFKFYNEAKNTISLNYSYDFIQNADIQR